MYGKVPPLAASCRRIGQVQDSVGSEVVVMTSTGCTVSMVLPVTPASVAEMVVVPAETPVANPPH